MTDPKEKANNTVQECDINSLDCAEKKVHSSVAKEHPEWVDDEGECPSCVSLEHELADPHNIPAEITEN